MGLAIIGPAANYSAEGPSMFYGFHAVMAFPLLVVIPYAAFHSLASERQDRTFEMVLITSLNARQILSGKLCGIALQMMIYLSAIVPCLAFTYLLRGLDIFTIFLAVFYTCLMSLGMSALGLLLGTLSGPRNRQIAQAVIYSVALLIGLWMNFALVFGLLMGTDLAAIGASEFWLANLLGLSAFANAFALVFLAARSQLTSASQNRSTARAPPPGRGHLARRRR